MPTMKMKDDNNNNVVKEELAEGGNVEASVEGEAKQKMKKGPWTAAEDAMLIEYVNKYGEGNWNSVQKNSGLSRCGKSCRLRWANHLRPNLKKGAFSQDEEQIIIDLHAKLGNKWARMASQLPGRTDNEIKNFWNTRMKRRQRAGLPLYPPQVQDEALVFHAHQQYSAPPPPPPEPQPQPQSFSFSSLLSSSDYHDDHHTLNNYDTTHHHQLYHQNMGIGMGVYSVSPYGLNNIYGFDSSGVKAGMVLKSSREMRLCSTPSQTPTSSYSISTSGLHGFMGINANHYEVASSSPEPNTSSGLLDDLVVEAQALSRTKTQAAAAAGRKRKKSMAEEEHTTPTQTQRDDIDLSSSQSSTGKKAIGDEKDPLEEMNSMDDDLFSLLNNFPSQMPMPEWYRKGQNQSQNQQEDASGAHTTTDQELAWTLGTCWNNMPSIC